MTYTFLEQVLFEHFSFFFLNKDHKLHCFFSVVGFEVVNSHAIGLPLEHDAAKEGTSERFLLLVIVFQGMTKFPSAESVNETNEWSNESCMSPSRNRTWLFNYRIAIRRCLIVERKEYYTSFSSDTFLMSIIYVSFSRTYNR